MTKLLLLLLAVSGCATLGPNPIATGVSPVPTPTTDVTAQFGFMPGYYLSSSVAQDQKGAGIPQLLATIAPGKAVPGLVVGGRAFGESGDTAVEPIVGYRKALGKDQKLAVAALLYGTHAASTFEHAKYSMYRAGLQGAADLRLNGPHRWIEAHLIGSLSLTNVTADGTYCVDSTNGDHAVDCPEPPPTQVSSKASGVYPGVTLGMAADLFKHRDSWFHGARLEAMFGAGAMPRVLDGEQVRAKGFLTIGLAVSLSFGAR